MSELYIKLSTEELTILKILEGSIEGLYSAEIVDESRGALAIGNIFDYLENMEKRELVASRPDVINGRLVWTITPIGIKGFGELIVCRRPARRPAKSWRSKANA